MIFAKKNVFGKHFVSKNDKSLENNLIFKPSPFSKKKKKLENYQQYMYVTLDQDINIECRQWEKQDKKIYSGK